MIVRWSRSPLRRAAAYGCALTLAALGGCGGSSAGKPVSVSVSPSPGVRTASPETQISFRGAPAADIGTVKVIGSRSGAHSGRLEAHSDGNGASFVLDHPLRGGERVTVRTALDVPNAKDGNWSFLTVSRPKSGLGSNSGPPPPNLLRALLGQTGKAPAGAVGGYHSRPDLHPPEIEIRHPAQGTAPGHIFISPKKVFGAKPRKNLQSGPMIVDDGGQLVWFAHNDGGNVTDFRVQRYRGRPVLTWWEGRQVLGTGEGEVQIADQHYQPIKRVRGGNGYRLDFHETTITPRGTLLGIVFNPVSYDLRKVGGPKDARVIDPVVQEIDIATGLVRFEWHGLGHVSLKESYAPVPKGKDPLYDYMHLNSIGLTNDGNILISGRETHSVMKIDRRTGRVLWRLGGKRSTFDVTPAVRFAWQHDARMQPDGSLRIFDNESAPKVRDHTRVIVVDLDRKARKATLRKAYEHPEGLLVGTQGNSTKVGDGHLFVGWGSQGYFSEFAADGTTLFDARLARGSDTYRAYREAWHGSPRGNPAVAARRNANGMTVWASWNGATEVASWNVLAGDAPGALEKAGSGPRKGFETQVDVDRAGRYVAVEAVDGSGKVLGRSKPIKLGN